MVCCSAIRLSEAGHEGVGHKEAGHKEAGHKEAGDEETGMLEDSSCTTTSPSPDSTSSEGNRSLLTKLKILAFILQVRSLLTDSRAVIDPHHHHHHHHYLPHHSSSLLSPLSSFIITIIIIGHVQLAQHAPHALPGGLHCAAAYLRLHQHRLSSSDGALSLPARRYCLYSSVRWCLIAGSHLCHRLYV